MPAVLTVTSSHLRGSTVPLVPIFPQQIFELRYLLVLTYVKAIIAWEENLSE